VIVQQHDRHAAPPKVKRGGKADRPAADDDHLVAHRAWRVLIGRLRA
jgi:hypothetical protein